MIASGTFGYDGYGNGLPPNMDLSRVGAIIHKTFTRLRRDGNPEPRTSPHSYSQWREYEERLFLNSNGLANPGIETALSQLAPRWPELNTTVLLSLSAESAQEFGEMASMTCDAGGFQAIELNLSCPNVKHRKIFAHNADLTAEAVAAAREQTSLPILAKLAPNVPDVAPIAEAAVEAGADCLTISNTIPAMRIDVETRRPALGAVTGGLSGPGLRPVALAMVYRAAQVVDVPIVGVGGIFHGNDAVEFLLAGATAVQVGSANLADLWAPFRIVDQLTAYMGENGIPSVSELVGAVDTSPRP
jgi:dihydroorotate dehydrogenase (NAD+) catalytic subunit